MGKHVSCNVAPGPGSFVLPSSPDLSGILLSVPEHVPRAHLTRFERWLALRVLRLGGWRMRGTLPDVPRAVVIVAPHSSNWDGVWVYCAAIAMGVRISILGKEGLFRVPLMGALLRRYGGVPAAVNSDAGSVADQWIDWLARHPHGWIGMAPEGTRKPVPRWRIGFWKIARSAQVPIIPLYLDYASRSIGLLPPFTPGDDMQADVAALRAAYAPWKGKFHDVERPS